MCVIGGSIYNDIEALKHIKASYFPCPPDNCLLKVFCKSKGNKVEKTKFSGEHGCVETLHLSFTASQQRNGHCSSMAKTVNMLQRLREEQLILQVDQ